MQVIGLTPTQLLDAGAPTQLAVARNLRRHLFRWTNVATQLSVAV